MLTGRSDMTDEPDNRALEAARLGEHLKTEPAEQPSTEESQRGGVRVYERPTRTVPTLMIIIVILILAVIAAALLFQFIQ
jgi:hypothetical protein